MRGYGHDYDRNFIERAGDTVRGWFGGGRDRDYDRDYGFDGGSARGLHRDWDRGGSAGRDHWETDWRGLGGGGYRMNNWNNQRATRDSVESAVGRSGGGYYGMDYEDRGGWSSGRMRGSAWGGSDYGRDYNPGWNRGMNRGGMMGHGGMNRGLQRGGGMRDAWMGNEYGGGGYNAGNDWGDYNRGAYGGDRFRSSRSGGVEPGRYYDGYGIGSSGGQGYEPY
jgi:hypothetical protein